jgi:proteasome lid subunit RPN8/RPN11
MPNFSITANAFETIAAHVLAELPSEAVGFLAGVTNVVTTVYPLINLGDARYFAADPYSQYRAENDVQRAGQTILGVYHSHPDGALELSAMDVYFARANVAQVLVTTTGETVKGIRAFAVGETGSSTDLPVCFV